MDIDIKELSKQFPLCEFVEFESFNDLFGITFKLHGFTSVYNKYLFVLEKFIYIYNTIDYVIAFLNANNFKHYMKNMLIHDNIRILFHGCYQIVIDNDSRYVNADELIEIVKKELNIVTSYKPVIE